MQTATSTNQVRYPQPVELPPSKCKACNGEGRVWSDSCNPNAVLERCEKCDGTGWIYATCCEIRCHEPATTLVFDGIRMEPFCTEHAAPFPDVDVVSFLLRQLP